MTHDPDTPPRDGREAPRPHRDARSPDAQRTDAPETDISAAEDGRPSDMAYYRVPDKSGAKMFLGTIAIPLAVIVLIVVAVLVM